MNLALWLERAAAVGGDRPALLHGETVVADYATFHARAAALAAALEAEGTRPGDRVALFMKNCPDYLVALYGIWIAGAVTVPINAKLHAKEAAFIISDAGARSGFVTPDLGPALAEATDVPLVDVTSDRFAGMTSGKGPASAEPKATGDLAWLFYTSGTTGRPKGVRDHPRHADGDLACLPGRCRSGLARRRRALRRADEPRRRHLCARCTSA
jgi:long-chain acyl-CoA synthetase